MKREQISFEFLRGAVRWGTLGKDPNNYTDYKWVAICNMSNEHIENILKTQNQVIGELKMLFEKEIQYRKKYDIEIMKTNASL